MPLGKLIYMPEESTPTIATEGNREAVAYLELSEHADHYGRLFSASPKLLAAAQKVIHNAAIAAGKPGKAWEGDFVIRELNAAVIEATGGAS
jgi:hypothetical protein